MNSLKKLIYLTLIANISSLSSLALAHTNTNEYEYEVARNISKAFPNETIHVRGRADTEDFYYAIK